MTDIVGYVASLLFVLALIVVCAWLVRRFVLDVGTVSGGSPFKSRVRRLNVVEGLTVEGKRRLILVRRDNVEHLILIGGPSDLVVETAIEPPEEELSAADEES